MDMPENPSSATNEELRQRCCGLQSQVNILIFLLLLISVTVSFYLYAQDRWTNRDLQAIKPLATQMMQNYMQKEKPQIEAFTQQLRDYAKSHPDFRPIIEKYRLNDMPTNSAAK
jgi:hypothetical protein